MKLNINTSIRTDIESYRRKVNSFLIFINQISVYWWNKLFPFKNKFVLRPSKTGDQVRKLTQALTEDLKRIAPEHTSENCLKNIEIKISLKEIETLKQNLVESILAWIDCDGRNLTLKHRRYCILSQNYQSVRIENFSRLKTFIDMTTSDKLMSVLDSIYGSTSHVNNGDINNEEIPFSISFNDIENDDELLSQSALITGDY